MLDGQVQKTDDSVEIFTSLEGLTLKFEKLAGALDRGEAFGRIAFSSPKENLSGEFICTMDGARYSKSGAFRKADKDKKNCGT